MTTLLSRGVSPRPLGPSSSSAPFSSGLIFVDFHFLEFYAYRIVRPSNGDFLSKALGSALPNVEVGHGRFQDHTSRYGGFAPRILFSRVILPGFGRVDRLPFPRHYLA